MSENLVMGLHRQIGRVKEQVIPAYQKLQTGWPAVLIFQKAIEQAEAALNSGDVADMLRAYKRLEDFDT